MFGLLAYRLVAPGRVRRAGDRRRRPGAVAAADRRRLDADVLEGRVARAAVLAAAPGVEQPQVRRRDHLLLRGRRHEAVERVQRRDRRAGAGLGLEGPGAAAVDERAAGARVRARAAGAVEAVRVARREPVVRAFLHARRAERRRRLVLRRRHQRDVEVGVLHALDDARLLCRRRDVVAPAVEDHAGVVALLAAERQRGVVVDVVVLGRPAVRVLPVVAAQEAAVDEQALLVHLVVEGVRLVVALEAQAVEPHRLDQADLMVQARLGVAQEHVGVHHSAAAEDERLAVDREPARAVVGLGALGGEPRLDRADAERARARVRGRAALRRLHRELVERLIAHLVRPPQLRVGDVDRGRT